MLIEVEFHEPMFRADITIIECPFLEFAKIINERHSGQVLNSWDQAFALEDGTDAYQFHVNGATNSWRSVQPRRKGEKVLEFTPRRKKVAA